MLNKFYSYLQQFVEKFFHRHDWYYFSDSGISVEQLKENVLAEINNQVPCRIVGSSFKNLSHKVCLICHKYINELPSEKIKIIQEIELNNLRKLKAESIMATKTVKL